MAELAKTHITISDESAFANGIDTLIPLYVFATEQDKVIDEATGEIATGTTKALAGEVSVVTSKKDVIEKFGAPRFAEVNGTILQGDERNEVGLYALYDAMGAASVAYALRADIDLSQLAPVSVEPTSNVKNGTYWLDMTNTNIGMFVCTSATERPAKAWTKVEPIDLYTSQPTASDGEVGDYAVTILNGVQKVYEKTNLTTWTLLGTGKNVFIQSSIKYPSVGEYAVGDIWVKTTSTNNGASYAMKKWQTSAERWNAVDMPVCTSFVDAEVAYGTNLVDGTLVLKYTEGSTQATMYQYTKQTNELVALGTVPTAVAAGKFILSFVVSNKLKQVEVDIEANESMDNIVVAINNALNTALGSLAGLIVASNDSGKLKLTSSTLQLINVVDKTGILASGDYQATGATGDKTPSWKVFTDLAISETEPRAAAEEGTYWFNDDLMIDVLVNNGQAWQEYGSYTKSTSARAASVYFTSEEPANAVADDLWIDPSQDSYPVIKKYVGGDWELLDNTDQSTPDGVVFADARYYARNGVAPTFEIDAATGKVTSNLLDSEGTYSTQAAQLDPDAPIASTYPAGILLVNTRFTTNNVKEYKEDPFVGMSGTVYGPSHARWVSASGNAANGAGLFGKDAQRKMVVNALAAAVAANEEIRTLDYDFFFATCPGYPELDDELINLNTDKKEMFEIISDTPKTLAPQAKKVQEWGSNANNATSHGTEGRVLKNEYVVRQYPPMGLTSNVDGSEIAVPSSVAKMKNLLVLPRGQICAGTQNGQVSNLASVGYITDEEEYASVIVSDGLGEICCAQSINPIMPRRNTGLLIWGERTENSYDSSLSDEHAIITLLRLKRQLENTCQPFFFRINNASLRNEFYKALQGVLNTFVGTGEIYDYALEVESQNTSETIGRRELWAAIAIEIAKGVEQIYIPIRVVATGALSNS